MDVRTPDAKWIGEMLILKFNSMKSLKLDLSNFESVKLSSPKIIKLKGGADDCGETTSKDPTAYPSGMGVLDGRNDTGDWKDTGCC